jgi:hypothetical protein
MTMGKDAWAFHDEHLDLWRNNAFEHSRIEQYDGLASSRFDSVLDTISQSRDCAHL